MWIVNWEAAITDKARARAITRGFLEGSASSMCGERVVRVNPLGTAEGAADLEELRSWPARVARRRPAATGGIARGRDRRSRGDRCRRRAPAARAGRDATRRHRGAGDRRRAAGDRSGRRPVRRAGRLHRCDGRVGDGGGAGAPLRVVPRCRGDRCQGARTVRGRPRASGHRSGRRGVGLHVASHGIQRRHDGAPGPERQSARRFRAEPGSACATRSSASRLSSRAVARRSGWEAASSRCRCACPTWWWCRTPSAPA